MSKQEEQPNRPHVILQGGFGEVPDEVLLGTMGRVTSSSQMEEFLDCMVRGFHMPHYEDVRPGGVARHLGTAFHKYQEKRFDRDIESTEEKIEAAEGAVDEVFRKIMERASEFDADKFTADLSSWRTHWLEPALKHFENTQEENHAGHVLATEVPFWIVVQCHPSGRVDFAPFCVIGTIDQFRREDSKLTLGEWKTIDEKVVISSWLEHRELSPQHNVYQTVGKLFADTIGKIGKDTPDDDLPFRGMRFWPSEFAGIRYLFARRAKFPQKASKNGTVEERAKEWADTAFLDDISRYGHVNHEMRMIGVAAWMFDQMGNPFGLQKNIRACERFGSKCPLWDFCHQDVQISLLAHLIPNEDYQLKKVVDRATKLIREQMEKARPDVN